jgi:hypothetical protein
VLCSRSNFPTAIMALFFANQSNVQLIDQNYEAWRRDPVVGGQYVGCLFRGF